MKKNIFLILCCIIGLTAHAETISQQQALSYAKAYLQKQNFNRVLTNGPRQEQLSLVYECRPKASRGAMSSSDPLFYVFNRENEGGFIVVAGDDLMTPVMACTERGAFDKNTTNPGLKWWFSEAEATMSTLMTHPEQSAPFLAASEEIPAVEPMVKTTWNQRHPYNYSCPIDPVTNEKSVTGCAATALSQVLAYWGMQHVSPALKPVPSGEVHYETVTRKIRIDENLSNMTFDWDNLLNQYNGTETETQNLAIGNLIYACGVTLEMDYSSIGSGAHLLPDRIISHLGIDEGCVMLDRRFYNTVEWDRKMKQEMLAGRPVAYVGQAAIYNGGHAFVCCGYQPGDKYYINWGWGGYDDGYFLLTKLNSHINATGGTVSGTTGGFNVGQYAVVGIVPKNVTTSAREKEYPYYYEGISLLSDNLNSVSIDLTWFNASRVPKTTYFCIGYDDENGKYHTIHPNAYFGYDGWAINEPYYYMNYMEMDLTDVLADGEYTIYPTYRYEGETEYHKLRCLVGHDVNPVLKIRVSHARNKVEVVNDNDSHLSKIQVNRIEIAEEDGNAYTGRENKLKIFLDNMGAAFNGVITIERGNEILVADGHFIEANEKNYVIPVSLTAPTGDIAEDHLTLRMNGEYYFDVEGPDASKYGQIKPGTGKQIEEKVVGKSASYALTRALLEMQVTPEVDAFSDMEIALNVTVKNKGKNVYNQTTYLRNANTYYEKIDLNIPAGQEVTVTVPKVKTAVGNPTNKVSLELQDKTVLASAEYQVTNFVISRIESGDLDHQIYKNHTNKLNFYIINNGAPLSKNYMLSLANYGEDGILYFAGELFNSQDISAVEGKPVVISRKWNQDEDTFSIWVDKDGWKYQDDKNIGLKDVPNLEVKATPTEGDYISPVLGNKLNVEFKANDPKAAYSREVSLQQGTNNLGQFAVNIQPGKSYVIQDVAVEARPNIINDSLIIKLENNFKYIAGFIAHNYNLSVAGTPSWTCGGAIRGMNSPVSFNLKNNGDAFEGILKLARKIKNSDNTYSYEDLPEMVKTVKVGVDSNKIITFEPYIANDEMEGTLALCYGGKGFKVISEFNYQTIENNPQLSVVSTDLPNGQVLFEGDELVFTCTVTNKNGIYEGPINVVYMTPANQEGLYTMIIFDEPIFKLKTGETKTITQSINISDWKKSWYTIIPQIPSKNNPEEYVDLIKPGQIKFRLLDIPNNGALVRLANHKNEYVTPGTDGDRINHPTNIPTAGKSAANIFYMNRSQDKKFYSYVNGLGIGTASEPVVVHDGTVDLYDVLATSTKDCYDFDFEAVIGSSVKNAIIVRRNGDKSRCLVDWENNVPEFTRMLTFEINEICINSILSRFFFEKVDSLPVHLNAVSGQGAFATFFSPAAVDIPDGLKAYAGEISIDQSQLILKRLDDHIPANTAVLLWSENQTDFDLPIAKTSVEPYIGNNDLRGSVRAILPADFDPNVNYLTLGPSKTGNLGFYKHTGEYKVGDEVLQNYLLGFHAYLELPKSCAVNGFTLVFDGDELTGIEAVEGADTFEKDVYYDLSGRRVEKPGKGIYILNGKKIFIK